MKPLERRERQARIDQAERVRHEARMPTGVRDGWEHAYRSQEEIVDQPEQRFTRYNPFERDDLRIPSISAVSTAVSPAARPPYARQQVRQAQRIQQRTGSRWLIGLLSALLVIVIAVPIMYTYGVAGAFTPGTIATPTFGTFPLRTPNPHGATLAQSLRQGAALAYVNNMIAHMTLDQEIGQMMMISFADTQMSPALQYEIQKYHIGSAIIYAFNIKSGPQLLALDQGMQSAAAAAGLPPLLISTDQEGGPVNRLLAVDGPLPSASDMGATNDPNYVRQRGEQDAQSLASLGINLNLAPVVDVMNTTGGDLGGRTFGSTPQQVIKMAGAYLQGLQESGKVVGALKHFPGLGDVPADPHQQLYYLNRSLTDLENIDWAPYKALIATGQVYAVMSTHVVLTAVDPTRPASLSYPVLTGILRDKLGFNGVIITDGIYMKALTAHYTYAQSILYAVEAGNDIICSTFNIQVTAEAEQVLHDAVVNGIMSKSRIDDSVRRILLLKLRLGLLQAPAGA